MSDSLVILSIIINGLFFIGGFLLSLWWIYIPLFLFFVAKSLWLSHSRQRFINKMDWILLEVIPPREIQKTPRGSWRYLIWLRNRQGHSNRSKPNWKDPKKQSCNLYKSIWFNKKDIFRNQRSTSSGIQTGKVLIQCKRRKMRGLPGKRPYKNRDELLTWCLCSVRGV